VRIAVTGASGFIGARIAEVLIRAGHDVLPLGRRPAEALARPLAGYVAWDFVTTPRAPGEADVLVHCGARVGDWGSVSTFRATNVEGTAAVLRSFPGVARVIHISTASVYASNHVRDTLSEDAPLESDAHSPYALSKVEAERVVMSSATRAIVLRPHIVYGPGDSTLMPRVLAARKLGYLPVPGDGRNRVSITHVDNLVMAVECALSACTEGPFNIADADSISIDELLRAMLRRHGAADRLAYLPRALAWRAAVAMERVWHALDAASAPPLTRFMIRNLADEFTLDLSRARARLGYVPSWSFRDQVGDAPMASPSMAAS
jgi:nucleoside-diphosphate-sugar epimerase